MKIADLKTKKVYYDSPGNEKFYVSSKFWRALKAKKIRYMDAYKDEDIRVTVIKTLEIDTEKFETIFKQFILSSFGSAVATGKLPIDTVC